MANGQIIMTLCITSTKRVKPAMVTNIFFGLSKKLILSFYFSKEDMCHVTGCGDTMCAMAHCRGLWLAY